MRTDSDTDVTFEGVNVVLYQQVRNRQYHFVCKAMFLIFDGTIFGEAQLSVG